MAKAGGDGPVGGRAIATQFRLGRGGDRDRELGLAPRPRFANPRARRHGGGERGREPGEALREPGLRNRPDRRLADRDDDPNYNAYVIQAAAFFLIAALGLVWTVCACHECKKFTDCCCPNPECGPCACVECLPGFRPDASGDAKKTDGAGAVEMTEEV